MPRSLQRGWRSSVLVFALTVGNAKLAAAAEPDEATVEAARSDFAEGQSQFRSKKWSEALKSFERSYEKVPSPNAELMVARCLRELGRGPDAALAYKEAEAEARKRVKQGESKYSDTADAAFTEGSQVRATLGTVRIHVTRGPGVPLPALSVDKKSVALSSTGDATVLHDPGSVQVTVRGGDGAEQRQTATVTAGSTAEVELTVTDAKTTSGPPAATKPVPPPTEGGSSFSQRVHAQDGEGRHFPSWFWPASIAAGGVTVIAGGMGLGFGASSKSQFEALRDECGPSHCVSDSQRQRVADGDRTQTIANVSFGVAIAGAIATAIVLYLGLTSDKRPSKL